MKNFKNRSRKLKNKILFLLLVLSIFPIFIIVSLTINKWKGNLTSYVGQAIKTISVGLADKLSFNFGNAVNTVKKLTKANEMSEILFKDTDLILANFLTDTKIEYSEFIEAIYCLDKEGKVIASTNPDHYGSLKLKKLKEYYLGKKEIVFTREVKYFDLIAKNSILIAAPIKPFGKENQIGVLMLFINFKIFDDGIDTFTAYESKEEDILHSVMVDKNGLIIGAPTNYKREFLFKDNIKDLGFDIAEITSSELPTSHLEYYNDELNESFLLGYSKVFFNGQDIGWTVLTLEHSSKAFKKVNETVKRIIMYVFFLVTLIIIISIYEVRKVTDPLNRIVVTMNEIAKLKKFEKINITSDYEVGVFAQTFNLMVDVLNNKDEILKRRACELEDKNSKLKEMALNLENKVSERTKDLENSNEILGRSKADLLILSESLKNSYKKLEKLNNLKSEFISNMSHELKTPLNAVINFTKQIIEDWDDLKNDEDWFIEAKKMMNLVASNGDYLLLLISDMLDLEKIESGNISLNLKKNSILEVIEDSNASILLLLKEKNITIDVNYDDDIEEFIFDDKLIKQVTFNLLSNAIKFTDEGNISITIKLLEKELGNEFVSVAFADTGIGIDKKNFRTIFDRFSQVDASMSKKFKGAGLGLNLCKNFIELHGGTITVESELKKGSKFVFTLPYKKY